MAKTISTSLRARADEAYQSICSRRSATRHFACHPTHQNIHHSLNGAKSTVTRQQLCVVRFYRLPVTGPDHRILYRRHCLTTNRPPHTIQCISRSRGRNNIRLLRLRRQKVVHNILVNIFLRLEKWTKRQDYGGKHPTRPLNLEMD